jgi:ATP-dependent DNA helicase DinG
LGMEEVFRPGGVISQSFAGYEERPEQLEMARAVRDALAGGRHLVVEAGTGVGKSFAYLIPAIDAVCGGAGTVTNSEAADSQPGYKRGAKAKTPNGAGKVLISTFTITLQEQLTGKDIPLLQRCTPQDFTAVLAKGRSNYVCKRRLEFALRGQKGLFDDFASKLQAINDWANQTKDGSLSDLSLAPEGQVWDAVKSEHGNCRGRKCPHYGGCFYWRARRRLENADIIVANHALLFSDLVLRQEGASILPDYRYVIIDEAHNIEHVAEEHFGIDISNHRVKFLLDGLYNPRTHKGLLAYANANKAIDIVGRITRQAGIFFKAVREWFGENKVQTNGRVHRNFVEDRITGYLKGLRAELAKRAKQTEDADEKFEFVRFADRCADLVQDLDCFLTQTKQDHVYWVEVNEGRRATVRLKSAPVNVGPDVKRCLFDEYESVIMTSATLSSGPAPIERAAAPQSSRQHRSFDERQLPRKASCGVRDFDFFAGRIGLEDFDVVKLGSPFDYARQVTIYIEKDLPNPNERAFLDAAAGKIKKYIRQTKGRAFVLFTSYEMLDAIAERIADWLHENDIELLQQGTGLDRSALLKHFKTDSGSCLFGTDSFWQGVDVPGVALSNVIIVRLPFAVPDKPLIAGRLEQIRQQGGNPFFDYQLPSAIIKFKQGFGRLIRSKTDTGIVVILDSRIINKAYGAKFLAAIPKCRMKIIDS